MIGWTSVILFLFTAPDSGYAQRIQSHVGYYEKEKVISLAKALKNVSDVFHSKFVYEKSLLDDKTTSFKEGSYKKVNPMEGHRLF